jgi:hypothetical protein
MFFFNRFVFYLLQEDVPSSGVNVTEFISSHENDLSLPSLGHGISAQFMFSPDPEVSHGQVTSHLIHCL